jgi:acetoin utilization deacetylase AcuC-like enzyme
MLAHDAGRGIFDSGRDPGFLDVLDSGDAGYEYAMNELVVPAINKFQPQLLVFVVGQDSSAFDPNGRQSLSMEGYRKIGQIKRSMAPKVASVPN